MIYFGMDIKYIAGLFDGEGYVGVVHQRGHDCYSLVLTITNTNPAAFPGLTALYPSSRLSCKGGWGGRNCFTWRLAGPAARQFLVDVQPHVYIKRDQVDLALTFPIGRPGRPVSAEEQVVRASIYERLCGMKRVEFQPEGEFGRRELAARADVQEALSMYRDGLSCLAIAERINVKYPTVYYWIRQLGAMREKGEAVRTGARNRHAASLSRPEVLKAKELYISGMSAAEVARTVKRKPATVNAWLRKMGLTRSLSDAAKLRCSKEANAPPPSQPSP